MRSGYNLELRVPATDGEHTYIIGKRSKTGLYTCTCKDNKYRKHACKHIRGAIDSGLLHVSFQRINFYGPKGAA